MVKPGSNYVFYLIFGRIPLLLSKVKAGDECRFLLKPLTVSNICNIIDT